jgi:hypothetical protein
MRHLLDQARKAYDVIIVDAPPLLPVTDAALLTAPSDGALVGVLHGSATKEQLWHSIERRTRLAATACRLARAGGHHGDGRRQRLRQRAERGKIRRAGVHLPRSSGGSRNRHRRHRRPWGVHPMRRIVENADDVVTRLAEHSFPTQVVVISPNSNDEFGHLTEELTAELRSIAKSHGLPYVHATEWLVPARSLRRRPGSSRRPGTARDRHTDEVGTQRPRSARVTRSLDTRSASNPRP